jgi:CRP-like cAMP-binding protein
MRNVSKKLTDNEIRQRIEIAKAEKGRSFIMGKFNFRQRQTSMRDSIEKIQKALVAQSILQINMTGTMGINDSDLRIDNLINAMKNKPLERSQKDIAALTKILNTSLLVEKFKEDGIEDSSLAKVLFFCSMYINYKFLKKDQELFKIGDAADRFYIILKGKISILKPVSFQTRMTSMEYYQFLKEYKKNNELHLIKLIISSNLQSFPIDIKDFDNLDDILIRVKLRKILLKNPNLMYLKNFFEEVNVNPKKYGVDMNELTEISFFGQTALYENNLTLILDNLIKNDNFNKLETYRYFENEIEKKNVTLFRMKNFMFMGPGNYFGDYAIDSNLCRTATICAIEDTHFGFLEIPIYREYIQMEKQKLSTKEISFLIENFFFNSINNKVFEKKYFNHFFPEMFYKGNILFKDGENLEHIYFIKEGEIEIVLNRNILEIYKIIKYLVNLEFCETEGFEKYQLKHEPKSLKGDLKKKKVDQIFYLWNK